MVGAREGEYPAVHRHHGIAPGATGPAGWRDLRLPTRAPSAEGGLMASVTKLIKDFARSPKGQQLIEQVKEQASRPENRRKLEELRRRYAKRR
jgi:Zn-dependent M32 family carboxypeptidase